MTRILTLLLFLVTSYAFCQNGIAIEKRRPWISDVEFTDRETDTAQAGGYSYLLLDRQFNIQTKEQFFRRVLKVRTEKGLESVSSMAINFDPSYQKLYVHAIQIIRKGKVIDKTRTTKIETIRREENMDRLLYDRSLDAVWNLSDTQVGDIVDYSYSIVGTNPVFGKRWARALYFNFEVPVDRLFTKIVVAKDDGLDIKLFNNAKEGKKTIEGNNVVYTWDDHRVPSLLSEDNLPSWYDGYDNIELSQYKSWQEVAEWAMPLYSNRSVSSAMQEKVREIRKNFNNVSDQINACIEFVQDEIRYLGFEGGIQGYKPHEPSKVFEQRFGDCKDKSLLLTYLLKELNVKSYPALVSTIDGKMIDQSLPSPVRFNHCIVMVEYEGSNYWIDPTSTLQRGSLQEKTIPAYHHALVIADNTTGLTAISPSKVFSSVDVVEEFTLDTIGRSAVMVVTSTYTGSDANGIRNYWKSTAAEEITKSYADYYSNDYFNIRASHPVDFKDDESLNILEVKERYFIPEFWEYDSAASMFTALFYARVMSGHLTKPSTKIRKMPVSLNHPTSVSHSIIIHVPEPWGVDEKTQNISTNAFGYSYSVSYNDQVITLNHKYETHADHVAPADIKNHIQKIDDAIDNLSYQLTYTTTAGSFNLNVPFVIVCVLFAGLLFFGLTKLYHYDPRSQDYSIAYDQLGGLMLLPLLGLAYGTLSSIYSLHKDKYFDALGWRILTDSAYGLYNPSRGVLILLELIFFVFTIIGSVFLLRLALKRRTSFPILMCWFLGIRAAFQLLQSVWISSLDNTSLDFTTVISIIFLVLWTLYFYYSDRVKGTFRERLERT